MLIAAFFRKRFKESLTESGPPSTFVRLLTSYHLAELQTIAFWTLFLFSLILLWFIISVFNAAMGSLTGELVDSELIGDELKIVGGAFAVAATVLSWTYQTGNKRLGVIDLFASEISAICRMSLITDFALSQVLMAKREHEGLAQREHVGLAQGTEADSPIKFTSEEHYTPVYDGNLSDLESLNVDVISNVTEFYSYRKAMMDYLRRMSVESDAQRKHSERNMMIYMQFLMYESARNAIMELIEFEPNLEESKINILCSELVVFDYLKAVFNDKDYRGERLRIREYNTIIQKTLDRIKGRRGLNWMRAQTTAKELLRRAKTYNSISEAST